MSYSVSHPLDNLPVKFVLYTHYKHDRQDNDLATWKKQDVKDITQLESFAFLVQHLTGLQELLESPAQEGLLVIFFDPGFAGCLEGIAEKKAPGDLRILRPELEFAEQYKAVFEKELNKHGRLTERVRLVTALDLCHIFGRMDWSKSERLRWWFMGQTSAVRYDSPKIVEAIVRVRQVGSGIPVFRLDWDVLFRGDENKHIPDLGLFKAVTSCLRAYQLRRDDPRIATFLFSAWYNVRDLSDPECSKKFEAWRGAFATRVFPALLIDKDQLSIAAKSGLWDEYAARTFNEQMARQFYGLANPDLSIAEYQEGIGYLGANPTASVVSGAFLCLSDSAIIELPPFSNFGLNVSWIDDHLKYCLHRELRHLTTVTLKAEPLLSDAKLDSVMVTKKRAPITNLPQYVFGGYLPTLLWGMIMDAWINQDPLIKFRPESMSEVHQAQWQRIRRQGQSDGVFAQALQAALERAVPSSTQRNALKERLTDRALARIREVRMQWARLVRDDQETFASLWVKGEVSTHFPSSLFPNLTSRCLGLVTKPNLPPDLIITRDTMADVLNPHLMQELMTLVGDAYEYLEFVLSWPSIMQVIRSVEPGTVRTDLSWRYTATG